MPRQFRVRKYNSLFGYMPMDLYEDISKDCLDIFDRYEWLGTPFLEDLCQPLLGILHLLVGVIFFPVAIVMSMYEKSFNPILSSLCRLVRGITQLITTPLLPFKITLRLVLMKFQEKVSAETMLSTWEREGMELTVTSIRETLTLLETEYNELLETSSHAVAESNNKNVTVSTPSQSSDWYVLIKLKNRYTEYGKKCYIHTNETKNGAYIRKVVRSIPAPMSDNEVGGYIQGLISRYQFLIYKGHKPENLGVADDFIREGESVAEYFDNDDSNQESLTVSRYTIRHAHALLDYFYLRISLEELSTVTQLPKIVGGIIAGYSPELFKSHFQVTNMEYKKRELHEFIPYYPAGEMRM